MKHFKFYNNNYQEDELYDTITRVYLNDNETMYDRKDFFSDKLYYGDYDKANDYVVKRYNIRYEECAKSINIVLADAGNYKYDVGKISITENKEKLYEMIEYLRQETGDRDEDEKIQSELEKLTYPRLNVLDVRDIEKMIERIVDEISERVNYL